MRSLVVRVRSSESTKQSVGNDARTQQLQDGGERWWLSLKRPVEVSPRGWDKRARAVGQHEHEQKFAPSVLPAQYLQRLALEGVAPAHNGYPLGVPVKVVVMGSVSCLPSTG